MKYSMITPCYNEADNMETLLGKIRLLQAKYDLEWVLVENGSADGSREYLKKYVDGRYDNIKIVYVEVNRGYGYGIQRGLAAASGDYVGWIHADMQVAPEELGRFFDEAERSGGEEKLFLKGRRTNRSLADRFFTNGQALFDSLLFGRVLYDIGAVPVLFHRSLLTDIDGMPNDFSIELYVYKEAAVRGFRIIRIPVRLSEREKGGSSWNRGLRSKVKQSMRIFRDSLKIRLGRKVL